MEQQHKSNHKNQLTTGFLPGGGMINLTHYLVHLLFVYSLLIKIYLAVRLPGDFIMKVSEMMKNWRRKKNTVRYFLFLLYFFLLILMDPHFLLIRYVYKYRQWKLCFIYTTYIPELFYLNIFQEYNVKNIGYFGWSSGILDFGLNFLSFY